MNDRNVDQLLDAWLDLGPDAAPDRVRSAVALEVRTTRQAFGWSRWASERFPSMNTPVRVAAALAAAGVIAFVGFRYLVPDNTGTTDPTASAITSPSPPPASITESDVDYGWPTTSRNSPGVYSWNGSSCGRLPGRGSCIVGWMHNGYGSGDVEIFIDAIAPGDVDDPGTAVSVAGHDGTYRRIDAQQEEWIVEIGDTTMSIRLTARPGTSQDDLDEAHAIIESMRTEPRDSDLGFRLVFTLTTDDWDSG